MLSMLPVFLMGLFFGLIPGILGAVLLTLLNIFLIVHYQIASSVAEIFSSGIIFGAIGLLLMGSIVGYTSGLRLRLESELRKRLQTEQELYTQTIRMQEILTQQTDLICHFDQSLNLTYINPALCLFLNKTEKQLLGNHITTFFNDREKKFVLSNINKLDSSPILFTLPFKNFANEEFYFQWAVNSSSNGKKETFEYQAVGRNITKEYFAQVADKESRAVVEALKNSAAVLNSSLNINEVLTKVLETIGTVVPNDAANIMLVEKDYAKMVQMVGYENRVADLEVFRNLRFPLTLSNFHRMIMTEKPVLIPDTDDSSVWIQVSGNEWIQSYLGAPLTYKGALIGVLNLDSSKKNFFTPKHADWLQAFADQAATAIKNAQFYEEVNDRARQLSILNQATHIAIYATTLEEISQPIDNLIKDLIKADFVQLLVWDDPTNQFHTTQMQDPSAIINPFDINAIFHNELAYRILHQGEIFISEQLKLDERIHPNIQENLPFESYVILPLIVDHRKLGIILIGFIKLHRFHLHETVLLEQFARQTSLAISKTQLLALEQERSQSLVHTNRLMEGLTRVASVIELDLNLDDLLNKLGEELQNIQIESMIALRPDNQTDMEIRFVSLHYALTKLPPEFRLISRQVFRLTPQRYSNFHLVVEEKKTLYFVNAKDEVYDLFLKMDQDKNEIILEALNIGQNTRAFVAPLIVKEETIGILTLWSEQLESHDLSAVNIFCHQIASAIEKNKLYQEISQLALTDSLTGLYNRRALEEFGNHEVDRAIRFNSQLSALMLDIDHFKHVNDTYGHLVGDEVLIQLAQRIRACLRDVDIQSRYGGEEFFILLPETDIHNAKIVAERLRRSIACQPFQTTSGDLSITASIGICQVTKGNPYLLSLIRNADIALYQAKNSGRNSAIQFNHDAINGSDQP